MSILYIEAMQHHGVTCHPTQVPSP